MSCFSSLGISSCPNGDAHDMDIALNVIQENELRICCVKCDREVVIELTQEEHDKIYDNFISCLTK